MHNHRFCTFMNIRFILSLTLLCNIPIYSDLVIHRPIIVPKQNILLTGTGVATNRELGLPLHGGLSSSVSGRSHPPNDFGFPQLGLMTGLDLLTLSCRIILFSACVQCDL